MSTGTTATPAPEPVVSVVMPVHNSERFLDEAIRSIRNQTLTQLELLVVENGSTDRSHEIAARHAAADPRIRVIRLERAGISLAMNAGIEAARAKWIARMDADDVALPHRLERQLAVLAEQPDIAALGTYGLRMGSTGRVVGVFRPGPTSREEFVRMRDAVSICPLQSSVIFSRQLALTLGGFRPDHPQAEDDDFFSRIADEHLVLTIPEPLVSHRIHTHSTRSTRSAVEMLQLTRRAKINTLRRRAGKAELSQREFQELERRRPLLQRLHQELEGRSQGYYRYGGCLLAEGNPVGVFWLGLSAALCPPLPLKRLRAQGVLSTMWSESRKGLSRLSLSIRAAARSSQQAPSLTAVDGADPAS